MSFSPLIQQLIDSLRCLPGVGSRTAQRMALHLLERNRGGGKQLASSITAAIEQVGRCQQCRNLCETELCPICSSQKRDRSQLCVVETPMDVISIEQTGIFRGVYFVLLGRLSPLDGIGPEELQLHQLHERLNSDEVQELILATNPTVEGEATAYYISEMAKQHQKPVFRIAYGVPFGGELEYVDGATLSHAFSTRQRV